MTEGSDGWAELEQAKKLKIPCVSYFEALGMAMNLYYLIAVVRMVIHHYYSHANWNFLNKQVKTRQQLSVHYEPRPKSNYRAGKVKFAIVEACEYKRDFCISPRRFGYY